MRTIDCDARSMSPSDSRSSLRQARRAPCTYSTLERMLESGFLRSWTMSAVSSSFWRCAASSASRWLADHLVVPRAARRTAA